MLSNTDVEFLKASVSAINDIVGCEAFDFAVAAQQIGVYKPHAGAWLKLAETLGVPLKALVQVSANPHYDLYPARELGLVTVFVRRDKEADCSGFDFIIDTLDDLPRAFPKIMAKVSER